MTIRYTYVVADSLKKGPYLPKQIPKKLQWMAKYKKWEGWDKFKKKNKNKKKERTIAFRSRLEKIKEKVLQREPFLSLTCHFLKDITNRVSNNRNVENKF